MFLEKFPPEIFCSIIQCVDSYNTFRELNKISEFVPFVKSSIVYLDIGEFPQNNLFQISTFKYTIHQELEYLSSRLPPNTNILGPVNGERCKNEAKFLVVRVPCSINNIKVTLEKLLKLGVHLINGKNTRIHFELLDFESCKQKNIELNRNFGLFRSWKPITNNETIISFTANGFTNQISTILPLYFQENFIHKPTIDFILFKSDLTPNPEYSIVPSKISKKIFNTKKLPQLSNLTESIIRENLENSLNKISNLQNHDKDIYDAIWETSDNLKDSLLSEPIMSSSSSSSTDLTKLFNWILDQPLETISSIRFCLSHDIVQTLKYKDHDEKILQSFINIHYLENCPRKIKK